MKSKQMFAIGFWQEYTNNLLTPSIFDHVIEDVESNVKDKYLNYLNAGRMFLGVREVLECALDSTKDVSPHNIIYTDGKWIWSSGLAYYVDHYNFFLPKEFTQYMKEQQYTVPNLNLEDDDIRMPYIKAAKSIINALPMPEHLDVSCF